MPVEPQVLEVLCYLVEHRERMVPKTELLDKIWGDRFVSDSALTSRIKSARRAIGDNGRDQRLIRTVHGRGFRFVADTFVSDTGPAPATSPSPAPRPGPDDRGVDDRGVVVEALVDEVLIALRERRGLAVAVAGQAGSTRIEAVEAVLLAAAAEGALVGRGGGSGLRAFGGILDGPRAWIDRRPELLDALAAPCRDELVAVWAGEAPTSRPRLFVAVQELLVAAGRTGGAVLAVEDAHHRRPSRARAARPDGSDLAPRRGRPPRLAPCRLRAARTLPPHRPQPPAEPGAGAGGLGGLARTARPA